MSNEEISELRKDLLRFVHCVSNGEFHSPEQVNSLVPVVEILHNIFN